MTLTHAQLKRMAGLTTGYSQKDFGFWIDGKAVHLVIYNIIYSIDSEGGYKRQEALKSNRQSIDKGIISH